MQQLLNVQIILFVYSKTVVHANNNCCRFLVYLVNSSCSPLDMPADHNNMDDLFHMIERLAGDTLEDQRTSPTPRNTPEPASPASSSDRGTPHELQQRTRSHGSFRLSPRSSDSSPETRAKMRRVGSNREKKPLGFTWSIGQPSEHKTSGGKDESRKFKRTHSGAAPSRRHQQPQMTEFKRTYSPPIGKPSSSPPPPSSNPPPLPQHLPHHRLGLGVYGSSPDTINKGGSGPSLGGRPLGRDSIDHPHHPLDSLVREANATSSSTAVHGRQHSMPIQMTPDSTTTPGYSSSWQPPPPPPPNM